jgi:outer membrane protein assembly factor BamD (BamD/ComL family)
MKKILSCLLILSVLAGAPLGAKTDSTPNSTTEPVSSEPARKEPRHRALRKQRIDRKAQEVRKTISKMSFDELKVAKDALVAKKDTVVVAKYLEQMIKMSDDVKTTGGLMVELADVYFDLGELAKAELIFTEYARLYQGSDLIEYALYKAVLCSFYATLAADRDQTKTHETVKLANTFIARKDIFTKYSSEVETIRTSCYQRIVESEIGIFNFYMHQGNLVSAQQRLDNLNKEWLEKVPTCAHQLGEMHARLSTEKEILVTKLQAAQTAQATKLASGKKPKRHASKKRLATDSIPDLATDPATVIATSPDSEKESTKA